MKKFDEWLENIDPNTMPRNTYNLPRERLDFQKLNRKAVKITYANGNKTDDGFSVVTPLNRDAWNWEIRPDMEDLVAQKDILNNKNGLDDAKYMQIVMSAKKLGLM
jgi:hypothetical protein